MDFISQIFVGFGLFFLVIITMLFLFIGGIFFMVGVLAKRNIKLAEQAMQRQNHHFQQVFRPDLNRNQDDYKG